MSNSSYELLELCKGSFIVSMNGTLSFFLLEGGFRRRGNNVMVGTKPSFIWGGVFPVCWDKVTAGCSRLALVFVWDSVLRDGFSCYFSGDFC